MKALFFGLAVMLQIFMRHSFGPVPTYNIYGMFSSKHYLCFQLSTFAFQYGTFGNFGCRIFCGCNAGCSMRMRNYFSTCPK